jgi:V8-like Glu-specific endopeptidase
MLNPMNKTASWKISRPRLRPFAIAVALALPVPTAPPALPQSAPPGVIGDDDRKAVIASNPPWTAVGQVNIGGYRARGQCTGTLVRPNLVITAAHCLMNEVTSKPHPLRHIHFLSGVRGGTHTARAKAECLRFLDGYDFVPQKTARGVPLSALYLDVAAIVLDVALPIEPAATSGDHTPDTGEPLVHAAYPASRRYQLQAHMGCRLLNAPENVPVWLNDCDTEPSSSGGPVFVELDRKLRLAAVMVGAGPRGNTAIPLATWQELLDGKGCN